MNTINKQGPNRNFTLNYAKGPNGKSGVAQLTVENKNTGQSRTLSAFGATNGEQSIGGVHFNGPKAQGGVVGVKGNRGTVTAGYAKGPEHTGYRIAARNTNGELKRLWKGYV